MGLQLSACCGQCYDGASNMSRHRNGIDTQIVGQRVMHGVSVAFANVANSKSFLTLQISVHKSSSILSRTKLEFLSLYALGDCLISLSLTVGIA